MSAPTVAGAGCEPDWCICGYQGGEWSQWPMHWRPELVPPNPFTWLGPITERAVAVAA